MNANNKIDSLLSGGMSASCRQRIQLLAGTGMRNRKTLYQYKLLTELNGTGSGIEKFVIPLIPGCRFVIGLTEWSLFRYP